jgi:site-specific recombinase XerD
MISFNSFLAAQLTDYVAYRKSLGYSAKPLNTHLKAFDQYLALRKKEPVELPPSFFLEMRADLNMESRSVNRVLSSVRMFFGFFCCHGSSPLKSGHGRSRKGEMSCLLPCCGLMWMSGCF